MDRATVSVSKIAPLYKTFSRIHFILLCYFKDLWELRDRMAFTEAWLILIPSAILEGRFRNMPDSECACPCVSNQDEDLVHTIVYIVLYKCIKRAIFGVDFRDRTENEFAIYMLSVVVFCIFILDLVIYVKNICICFMLLFILFLHYFILFRIN